MEKTNYEKFCSKKGHKFSRLVETKLGESYYICFCGEKEEVE